MWILSLFSACRVFVKCIRQSSLGSIPVCESPRLACTRRIIPYLAIPNAVSLVILVCDDEIVHALRTLNAHQAKCVLGDLLPALATGFRMSVTGRLTSIAMGGNMMNVLEQIDV